MTKLVAISFFSLVFLINPTLVSAESGYELPDSVKSKISAISLSEIAVAAAVDMQSYTDLLTKNIQVSVLSDVRPVIDTLKTETEGLRQLSDQLLEDNLPLDFYNSLISRWIRISDEIASPEKILTGYSSSLEEYLHNIRKTRYKWRLTGEISGDEGLTDDIKLRIASVIHKIDSATFIIKDSLNVSIELQNQTTDLKIISDEYLANIQELQQMQLGNLILKKSAPIWNIHKDSTGIEYTISKTVLITLGIEDSKVFLNDHWSTIVLLFVTFILLLIFLKWLQKTHITDDLENRFEIKTIEHVISRPANSAYLFAVMLSIWWLPPRPILFGQIYTLILLLPFLFVFYRVVRNSLKWCLLYFTVLILLSSGRSMYQLNPLTDRVFVLVESFLIGVYLFWFMLKRRRIENISLLGQLLHRFLSFIGLPFFMIILIAFFSNFFGYNYLSELINHGVIFALIAAFLLGTAYLFITATIYSFVQTGAAHKSYLIKDRKDHIYHWLKRNIRLAAIIIWIILSLRELFLWQPIREVLTTLWEAGYRMGELNITVGNIFIFVLIIYLSWLISYVIKLLLQIEIFGRLNMPRGIPMAISSLTQYFLIILGFLIALSLAGFNLRNLSILAGALGVGIGFGLQHTVNNFISGLILAFERPVTVGDIVNVSGHEGIVNKIGIRASTIKQWDGSMVIVPNAELISSKVINWTLTRYERRFILTIHTNLKTDADKVLQLMKEAADSVEYVLTYPESKTYFHGIKDKYMEFKLFYWTSDNILECKRLVNLAVQKALNAAGIDFVMPVPLIIEDKPVIKKTTDSKK